MLELLKAFLKSWGTLSAAILALIQPWLLLAWRRLFRQGSVEIYETGTIEVGYSAFGATIGLHGTLRARDGDFFIRSARLEILKEKDQSRHCLDWGAFRSSKLVIGRPEEMTLELPAGFMLLATNPHRYNIQFHDVSLQDEIRPILDQLSAAWVKAIIDYISDPNLDPLSRDQEMRGSWPSVYALFSPSPEHVGAYTRLDRLCYWEPGRYRLTLHVETARPDRRFPRRWSFTLSENDCQSLRLNSLKIVQESCSQYFGQYNFAYVRHLAAARDLSHADTDSRSAP
jgi:hypothetical protein